MRLVFLLCSRRRLPMQLDGSRSSSYPSSHSGLKRSFAQQAVAQRLSGDNRNENISSSKDDLKPGKIPKIFRVQSPSSLSTVYPPAFEMSHSGSNIKSSSRSLRVGTASAPGSRSSSRVKAKRNAPPKKIFEGPYWNKAQIVAQHKSNAASLTQLKEINEEQPKSALSNWVQVVSGKLPNFLWEEGIIEIDGPKRNIFRYVIGMLTSCLSRFMRILIIEPQYLVLK
jgi:hypothetical protein